MFVGKKTVSIGIQSFRNNLLENLLKILTNRL